jgi:hypothetical protein
MQPLRLNPGLVDPLPTGGPKAGFRTRALWSDWSGVDAEAVTAVDPADTALLVARSLRRGSTLLAVLVAGAAVNHGVSVEVGLRARGAGAVDAHAAGLQHAGVALLIGLVSVLALHVAVGVWARRRLADRLEDEWAAVEPRWSHPRAM